jgi:hypothetical protein
LGLNFDSPKQTQAETPQAVPVFVMKKSVAANKVGLGGKIKEA